MPARRTSSRTCPVTSYRPRPSVGTCMSCWSIFTGAHTLLRTPRDRRQSENAASALGARPIPVYEYDELISVLELVKHYQVHSRPPGLLAAMRSVLHRSY